TLIQQQQLSQHVKLVGWVQEINRFFAEADGFLLTSHYEGFPLGLLEAMACGLCCVAMDCQSGPSEVIVDGENGLLVPASDVDSLTAAMTRVMSEPGLAAKLGATAT